MKNYSAYWRSFKTFLLKIPLKERHEIINKYYGILEEYKTQEEKLEATKQLIKQARSSYTNLPLTYPRKYYSLSKPILQQYFFPEDMKKRTYSMDERGSYHFNKDDKIYKVYDIIDEEVKKIAIKYFNFNRIEKRDLETVQQYKFRIYPILRYIYLFLSNKTFKGYETYSKIYKNKDITKYLNWDELIAYQQLMKSVGNGREKFMVLNWLLKILINYPDPEFSTDMADTHLDQHGRFNTPYWEVYW